MRVAPFVGSGINQQNTVAMGAFFHLVPHMHVLYFGPVECARHSFPGLVDDVQASILVVDDLQASMGETEQLVAEAVREISADDPDIEGFLLCTACQTAFLGLDFDALCRSLHESTGLRFAHIEFNRMYAGNIPGKTRKDIAGGDRLHVRRALCKMMERGESHGKGVLVLSDDPLDETNDLRDYLLLEGIEWVRSVGGVDGAHMLAECGNAALALVMTPSWREAGSYLSEALGIPMIDAPMSYAEDEIDAQYQRIDEVLEPLGSKEAWGRIADIREKRRSHARERLRQSAHAAEPLDLDLRVVNRPFTLVETLLKYGFSVRRFQPGTQQVNHKEPDEQAAFERLCEVMPGIRVRFAGRDKSPGKAQGSMVGQGKRGRFVDMPKHKHVERVPEETCWWGYSSIEVLMDYIDGTRSRIKRKGEQL